MPTLEEMLSTPRHSAGGFLYPESRFVSEEEQSKRDELARQVRAQETPEENLGIKDITSLGDGSRGQFSKASSTATSSEPDVMQILADMRNELSHPQKQPEPVKKATAVDYGKQITAGALDSLGEMAHSGGEYLAQALNSITGTEDFRAENPLKGTTDSIRDSMTAGGKQAVIESGKMAGDLLDYHTWVLPETGQGIGMAAAQGLGSLATWLVPAGAGLKAARTATALYAAGDIAGAEAAAALASKFGAIAGGISGFTSTGGDAATDAREGATKFLSDKSHEQLMNEVPVYAESFNQSGSQQQARNAVINSAGQWANTLSGSVGAVEGMLGGKFLSKFMSKTGVSLPVLENIKNPLVRRGLGSVIGVAVEGSQEAIEKTAKNVGENIATGVGVTHDVTRDTFPEAVGGALIGGPFGGIASRYTPPAQKPAPVTPDPSILNASSPEEAIQQAAASVEKASSDPDLLDSIVSSIPDLPVISEAVAPQSIEPDATLPTTEQIAPEAQETTNGQPNDVTGLATAASETQPVDEPGGLANLPIQPAATGSGDIAATLEPGGGGNLDAGNGNGGENAVGEVKAKVDLDTGLIVTSNGTPYKTEAWANLALKDKKLTGQYETVPVDGGFALKKLSTQGEQNVDQVQADNRFGNRAGLDKGVAVPAEDANSNGSIHAKPDSVVTPETAKVGDVVDMGGTKFRKTATGFERVDRQQTEPALSTNEPVIDNNVKGAAPELSTSDAGIVKPANLDLGQELNLADSLNLADGLNGTKEQPANASPNHIGDTNKMVESAPSTPESAPVAESSASNNQEPSPETSFEQRKDGTIAVKGFTQEQIRNAADAIKSRVVVGKNGNAIFEKGTSLIAVKRALGVDDLPAGIVLSAGDKPFSTQRMALLHRDTKGMKKTHVAVKVEGGYGLVPKEPVKTKKAPKAHTLLTAIRDMGGIKLSSKEDVIRDNGFAPGGYNQIFRKDARYTLDGLVGNGELDDFLPYRLRFSTLDKPDSEVADMTDAVEWLKEKIANGERVLPYDAQLELDQKNIEAQDLIESEQEYTDEEINELSNDQGGISGSPELSDTENAQGGSERDAGTPAGTYEPGSDEEEVTQRGDLLGQDTTQQQAISDLARKKDEARNGANSEANPNDFNLTGSDNPVDVARASGAQELASKPESFDDFVENYVNSQPIDKYEYERELNATSEQIRKDWQNGSVDEVSRTDGPKEIFAQLKKENGDLYFDEDGDLTDEGSQRYSKLEYALSEKISREYIGEPKRETVDFRDPADTAKLVHSYLQNLGFKVNPIGGSGKSQSKYFTIIRPQGNVELRISDHPLPVEYQDANGIADEELKLYDTTGDVRDDGRDESVGIDGDEALSRAKEFVAGIVERYGKTASASSSNFVGTSSSEMQERPAVRAETSGSQEGLAQQQIAAGGKETVPQDSTQVKDEVTKAKEALSAAGVTGKDYTDTVAQVRQGNLTADEVAEAHGQKIEDFGEKIGGARKDFVHESDKHTTVKKETENEGWRNRYKLIQWDVGTKAGKWSFVDSKKKSAWGNVILGNKYFDTEQEANDMLPLLAVSVKHRVYSTDNDKYAIYRIVGDRKRVRVVQQDFDSHESGLEYLVKNAEDVLTTKLSFGEEILPKPEKVYRSGDNRRTGDVSARSFMDAFGFRGVEFGNWVGRTEERQEVMNFAYDALLDLAEIINVPPKAISLNGDLALAFGSRGHGLTGAAAHYESDYAVINLTKMSGAGHLAHEWLHALDHYVARLDGAASSDKVKNERGDTVFKDVRGGGREMATNTVPSSYKSNMRPELREAYKEFINSMLHKAEKYVEDTQKAEEWLGKVRDSLKSRLDSIRNDISKKRESTYYKRNNDPATPEQVARFDELSEMLLSGESLDLEFVTLPNPQKRRFAPSRYSNKVVEEMSAIYKDVRGRNGFDSQNRTGIFDYVISDMRRYQERIKTMKDAESQAEKTKAVPTKFRRDAIAADQARSGEYWATNHELAARAFAAYVEDKLFSNQSRNDFLVYHAHGAILAPVYPEGLFRPYPEGDERTAINSAFDKLFSIFQTKETDKGVALHEPEAQYGNYELHQATGRSAGSNGSAEGGNVHAFSEVPEYLVKTIVGNTQSREIGASRVRNAADAAAATHYLNKSAVERFDALILDANDKPIAVVGNFKGAITQATVYPSVVISEAVRVPGAAKIWFSHNHPSGFAELSDADIRLYGMLHDVFNGSGIEPMGILAVTSDGYDAVLDPNDRYGTKQTGTIAEKSGKTVSVPVIERELVDDRKVKFGILSPTDAKDAARRAYDNAKSPGIILLDAQHGIAAWLPLAKNMLGELRNTGGMKSLYDAISMSNASAAIMVHGGELDSHVEGYRSVTVGQNIGAALKKIDVKPLDIIDAKTGKSSAESGLDTYLGPVYSRGSETNTGFTPDQLSKSLRSKFGGVVDKLLARGEQGKRGGVVIASDMEDATKLFSKKSGRTLEQAKDQLQESLRIMKNGYRTVNDFIIPETPEFEGNKTGDLAYIDGKPIRLAVGRHPEQHRGFGIVKLAGEADNNKNREAPNYTDDRAENFARHVVGVANSADSLFEEDEKVIIRSSRMKEALVLQDMGDYWSIVSDRPAEKIVWGVPVRTGRGLVQSLSQWSASAPLPSSGVENNPLPDRKSLGVQTERFDITKPNGPLQEKKQTIVTVKKQRKFDILKSENGVIQGFYDPKSGLTYLIADHLNDATGPSVLAHEILHGTDNTDIQDQAAALIGLRESALMPIKTREFLSAVQSRMETAGVENDKAEAANYIVEQALTVGRQNGFSAIDDTLFGKLTNLLGKRVSDFVRNFIASVRASLFKRGVTIKLAVDDFIALAKAGMKQAADGDVNSQGDVISRSVSGSTQPKQQSIPSPEWSLESSGTKDNLIYTLQDKHIDTRRVLQKIREVGGDISDKLNVYQKEELYHKRAAKRVQDFVDFELKPLYLDMAMRGINSPEQREAFEEYLLARHAKEANQHIREINPDMSDGGSGMTDQEADDYFANLDDKKRKAYESLASRVDNIIAKTRQTIVDYKLEPQSVVDGWANMFEHYVPLNREDMEGGSGIGQGFSIKGKFNKHRTGSTKNVVDILANIAQQRDKAIIRGEKNKVSTALFGLAALNPNPDFWQAGKVPMKKDVVDGKVITYQDPFYKNAANVVMFRHVDNKGVAHDIAVVFNEHNERAMRMATALKNLDSPQLGEYYGSMAKVTRYIAAVNTQYNPVFGLFNFMRDIQGAMLNLSTTPLKGKEGEILTNAVSALKDIYLDSRAHRKGGVRNSAIAKLYEQFQNDGATTGYRDMFANAKERSDAIDHALDPDWWAKTPLGKVATLGGVLHVPEQALINGVGKPLFHWLSDFNETMENATRFAAYKAALDHGLSREQAASIAKNLTVNFNRKGHIATQAGALYAFFNASVQGTARIAETLSGPRGRQVIAGGILLGVMDAFAMMMAGIDDDDPKEFVKARNIIIPLRPITGDKDYFSIPMPLGFHVIPNIGRLAVEGLFGKKTIAQAGHALIVETFEALNPIGTSSTITQTITPTPARPIVDLAINRDWTDRKISNEDYDSRNPTPGYTRARDGTNIIYKKTAEFLNSLTGGDQFYQGGLSPTPEQIEYLVGQATGGVGREGSKVIDMINAPFSDEELPTYKIPILGRLYGKAEGTAHEGNRYYDNITKINIAKRAMKELPDEEVDAYVSKHPEVDNIYLANNIERQIDKLKDARKAAKEEGNSAEAKEINNEITGLMKELNDAMEEVGQQ